MISLRSKLAFSYGLLIAIILAVSLWGVYNFVRLGHAVEIILLNNHKSIIAAENMKEALERQDSAALFSVAGYRERSRAQFAQAGHRFQQEFSVAANNITEPGETEIIADINARYNSYQQTVAAFINSTEALSPELRSRGYFEQLEPQFLELKARLDNLLQLNQQAMVTAQQRAREASWRAQISTAILAVTALLFALFFAWASSRNIVKPIAQLTETAKQIGAGNFDQHIEVQTTDDIGMLAAEFNNMAARLRDLRQSDSGRLLMERKKADAALDAIYDPVIVSDAQGQAIRMNTAARRIFGVPAGSNDNTRPMMKIDIGESISAAVRNALALQQPVAAEGEAALVALTVDGREHSFRLRAMPMRDDEGRLLGAVSILEDITSLREVDRLKTEFITVASDRMRKPLHSLRLALHALIGQYAGDLNDKQLELLDSARAEAEQLDEIMSDLLELAEIESGERKLAPSSQRPIELARAAIERQRAAAEAKHIDLINEVSPDLPRVQADAQSVRRIFENLLSNAIRHTGHDGKVTVSASERDNLVVFMVADTGEGIPQQYLPRIFSRFVNIEESAGGRTGLGLALVKRLVESQGGQVGVESRVGEGTTFTFSLPASLTRVKRTGELAS